MTILLTALFVIMAFNGAVMSSFEGQGDEPLGPEEVLMTMIPPLETRSSSTGTSIIAGLVIIQGTQAPIYGVNVTLTKDGSDVDEDQTDMMGYYQFLNLTAGIYTVAVERPFYLPTSVDVTVGEDDVATAIINMTSNGSVPTTMVEGKVFDTYTGTPLVGADVTIGGRTATTGTDGWYRIWGLVPGEHNGTAVYNGAGAGVYTTDVRSGISQAMDSKTRQDFMVSPTPATVTGTIELDGDFPFRVYRIPFATFEAERPEILLWGETDYGGVGPYITTVSKSGDFEFTGLPPAKYTLMFDHPTFYSYEENFTLMPGQTHDVDIDLEIEYGTLEIDVYTPFVNQRVPVRYWYQDHIKMQGEFGNSGGGEVFYLNYTKDNTKILYDQVPPGNYRIEFLHGYMNFLNLDVVVEAGQTTYRSVELMPDAYSTNVTFDVMKNYNPESATYRTLPMTEGTVTIDYAYMGIGIYKWNPIYDLNDTKYFPTTVFTPDEDGMVRFTNMPMGYYLMRIQIPGIADVVEHWNFGAYSHGDWDWLVQPNLVTSVHVDVKFDYSFIDLVPYTVTLQGTGGTYSVDLPNMLSEDTHDIWEPVLFEVPNGAYTLTVDHPHYNEFTDSIVLGDQYGPGKKEIVYLQGANRTTVTVNLEVEIKINATANAKYAYQDVVVTTQYSGPSHLIQETTDDNGTCSFDVLPGLINIQINGRQHSTIIGSSGATIPLLWDNMFVNKRQAIIWGITKASAEVGGRPMEGAVSGATVTLSGGGRTRSTTSDDNGYYEVHLSNASSFTSITFEKAGLVDYIYQGSVHTGTNLDAPLYTEPSVLTVTVTDQEDSTPINDSHVSMGLGNPWIGHGAYESRTGPDGTATIGELPKGDFTFFANKGGYFPHHQPVTMAFAQNKSIAVQLEKLPPPEISSVVPEYTGGTFVAHIDLEMDVTATVAAGDSRDPLTHVRFFMGDQIVTVQGTGPTFTATFNMHDLAIYPEQHTLRVLAYSTYGSITEYTHSQVYTVVERPDWLVSLDNIIQDYQDYSIDTPLLSMRIWTETEVAPDASNYVIYRMEMGYEFKVELDQVAIFQNVLGWSDGEDVEHGLSFSIEMFVSLSSAGTVTGGGSAEYEFALPMGDQEVGIGGRKLAGEVGLSGSGNLAIEVDVDLNLDNNRGERIEVTEIRIEGGMELSASFTITLEDLINWMARAFAAKTFGLSLVIGKVLAWVIEWVAELSATITVAGAVELEVTIDATRNSTIFPDVPFSWESGSGTQSMTLGGSGSADVGGGYIGSIEAGFTITATVELGFPDPFLRQISLTGEVYVEGSIAWWEIPDDARTEYTFIIYQASEGTRAMVPVYTRATPMPMSGLASTDRPWLDTHKFEGKDGILYADTAPFASPELSVAQSGKAKVLMVEDYKAGELPLSMGIKSTTYDGTTWSPGPWVDSRNFGCYSPTFAYDESGGGIAVWCQFTAEGLTPESHPLIASSTVELYASVYDGTNWATPVQITDNDVQELGPKLVYDSGRYVFVWKEDRDMNPYTSIDSQLQCAVFTPALGWGRMDAPTSGEGVDAYEVAAHGGAISLAFLDEGELGWTSYDDGWSSAISVGTGVTSFDLATNGGETYIIHVNGPNGEGNMSVSFVHVDDEGKGGSIVNLASRTSVTDVSLVLDDELVPVASWTTHEDGQTNIEMSKMSGVVWSDPAVVGTIPGKVTGYDDEFAAGNHNYLALVLDEDRNTEVWVDVLNVTLNLTTDPGTISVDDIEVSVITLKAGEQVTITSTITTTASIPVVVGLYVDDVLVDGITVTSSGEVQFVWFAEAGTFELKVVADINDALSDPKTDNEKTMSVTVEASETEPVWSLEPSTSDGGDGGGGTTDGGSTDGNTTDGNETEDDSIMMIVIVTIIIVVGLIIVGVVVFLLMRKKEDEPAEDEPEEDIEEEEEDLDEEEEPLEDEEPDEEDQDEDDDEELDEEEGSTEDDPIEPDCSSDLSASELQGVDPDDPLELESGPLGDVDNPLYGIDEEEEDVLGLNEGKEEEPEEDEKPRKGSKKGKKGSKKGSKKKSSKKGKKK